MSFYSISNRLDRLSKEVDLLTIDLDQIDKDLKDAILFFREKYQELLEEYNDPSLVNSVALTIVSISLEENRKQKNKSLSSTYNHYEPKYDCDRCKDRGYLSEFKHIQGGRCFACNK
jgi:hypothetical protein